MRNAIRLIALIFLSVFSPWLWSACSPYVGLASINEISKEHNWIDNEDDFFEVKKLDNQLNNSVMQNWTVEICESVFGLFISCSGNIPLSNAKITGKYWVVAGEPVPASYIDWIGGFDVVLRDENGDVVDYVSVNNITENYEDCAIYDDTADGAASTRRMRRSPDGVGDWNVPTGNSEPPTEGEDNSDTPPPPVGSPDLSFLEDVIVGQGQTATLTFVLSTTYTSDVVIDYATVNGDAVSGVDYVSESGSITIPSGNTTATLDINTLVSGTSEDRYFFLTIESATNAIIVDQVAQVLIVAAVGADHFNISHSGQGVNCEPSLITISAMDPTGTVLTNYSGTIDLSVDSNHGDWSNATGNGSLISSGGGIGQYNFVSSDNGQVQLLLSNSYSETININVLDAFSISENSNNATASDDPDLTFAQSGFKFIYGDGSSPASENIPDQTAGRPFSQGLAYEPLKLRAITTDLDTGVCTGLFNGNQIIELALECNNPTSCHSDLSSQFSINGQNLAKNGLGSITQFSSVSLNFSSNSTADLPNSFYSDAGTIKLHARFLQQGDNILGSSLATTYLPAGFCVTTTDANYQCAGPNYWDCSAFKKSGENFTVEVQAQGWRSDSDSDYCDNNFILNNFNGSVDLSPSLLSPSGGSNGSLSVSAVSLNAGTYSGNIYWNEVGVLTIGAGTNLYLGSTLPSNNSHEFGRFYPNDFLISNLQHGSFSNSNTGFSYVGEQDQFGNGGINYAVAPTFDFVARNVQGDTVLNYLQGSFFKSPAPIINPSTSILGLDGVTPLTISAGYGSPAFSYDGATGVYTATLNNADHYLFERDANSLIAPFTNDIALNINNLLDSDGTSLFSSAVINPSGGQVRFGRLYISNAYGAETSTVVQQWRMEYFDGDKFVTNSLDSGTAYDLINIGTITVTDEGNALDPLLPSDTSASGEISDSGSFSLGILNVIWSPPVDHRYGTIRFSYNAPAWLDYDWLETGFIDPVANVSFGQYRGVDKVIYWKEINY